MSQVNTVVSPDNISVDDLYAYIDHLERTNVTLEYQVQSAKTDNLALRRSIAAFKANKTRRVNARA